ncbi:PLC-like phosphodiesterase [Aspergillus ibericus CBS 121593]|uniref:PLC-like phosphodiesterase n=1 Tax=Aspergillus ibericus CBS 121593 TaxID=1448316 RepID=A0A395H3K3_9EURO|nr:PLC-like phosphodiesterase [Aspergillus ibericus CBS 121593]RAL01438.1 PLC-like phosphodiesterase [Aspergillus ibericus CBS 121593]
MAPTPTFPQKYGEGDLRLSVLKALADIERQCSGYYVFIWQHDGQPSPECSHRAAGGRFEVVAYGSMASTYRYDYVLVTEGRVVYRGNKHHNMMVHSQGANITDDVINFPPNLSSNPHQAHRSHHRPRQLDASSPPPPPPDLHLSAFTIPGTHNSAAGVGAINFPPAYLPDLLRFFAVEMAECQTASVAEQLEMGIRFIDLRTSGTDLTLRHGRVELRHTLREILDVVNGFLDSHPDETVRVAIKRDMESITGDRQPETDETRRAAEDCFSSYARAYTDAVDPTLEASRGKMVLLWEEDHGRRGIRREYRGGGPQGRMGVRRPGATLAGGAGSGAVGGGGGRMCGMDGGMGWGCNSYWVPGGGGNLDRLKAISDRRFLSPRLHAEYTNWRLGVVQVDFALDGL